MLISVETLGNIKNLAAHFLKYVFSLELAARIQKPRCPASLFKKGATCYRIALLILAALEGGRGSAQPLRRTRLTGVSTFSCGGSMPVGVGTDAVWRLCS